MPTKNTSKKARPKTRQKTKYKDRKKSISKKPSVFNEFKKILVGIAILVSLCLTVAMIADIFLKPGAIENKEPKIVKSLPDRSNIKPKIKSQGKSRIQPIQEDIGEVKIKKTVAGLKQKSEKIIKYEVFGEVDQSLIEKQFPKPQKGHIPKIVIIIDDIGYDKKIASALCDLSPDITFSVLPFAPFGKTISKTLHARGSQLMLHLPMEPFEYPDVNPGPGAILSTMTPDALLTQLKKNIKDIPYIVGVNNHMGSKITTNANQMNQIFTVLKRENLFFIDSRTAPKSQCKASARLFKLKFAQRDIFLDNFQNTEYITGQFQKLKTLARKHGFAIGIGHPYKATLHTLSQELPKLKNKIEIVRASSLTSIPG
jgi:uncharacterized protein